MAIFDPRTSNTKYDLLTLSILQPTHSTETARVILDFLDADPARRQAIDYQGGPHGLTPLYVAIECNNDACARLLLERGADPFRTCAASGLASPFLFAVATRAPGAPQLFDDDLFALAVEAEWDTATRRPAETGVPLPTLLQDLGASLQVVQRARNLMPSRNSTRILGVVDPTQERQPSVQDVGARPEDAETPADDGDDVMAMCQLEGCNSTLELGTCQRCLGIFCDEHMDDHNCR
jgi:hypothetical protein